MRRPRQSVTASQMIAYLGIAPPTYERWMWLGLISPSVRTSDGVTGRARLHSVQDVVLGRTAVELRKVGLKLPEVASALELLRASDVLELPAGSRLLLGGGEAHVVRGRGGATGAIAGALVCVSLDLHELVRQVREHVDSLDADPPRRRAKPFEASAGVAA